MQQKMQPRVLNNGLLVVHYLNVSIIRMSVNQMVTVHLFVGSRNTVQVGKHCFGPKP
jgi:hypothetical protein